MPIFRAFVITIQDLGKGILFFPVWWYSIGVSRVIHYLVEQVRSLTQSFRLSVLFKYLFVPMYGMHDIWSRILSVPVRIGHFFVLLLITILYTFFLSFMVLFWVVLPPLLVLAFFYHLEIF